MEFETAHAALSETQLLAWQQVIAQLAAWSRDPEPLRDEDLEPPSDRMIQLVKDYLKD